MLCRDVCDGGNVHNEFAGIDFGTSPTYFLVSINKRNYCSLSSPFAAHLSSLSHTLSTQSASLSTFTSHPASSCVSLLAHKSFLQTKAPLPGSTAISPPTPHLPLVSPNLPHSTTKCSTASTQQKVHSLTRKSIPPSEHHSISSEPEHEH